jgi:hypothetical protein
MRKNIGRVVFVGLLVALCTTIAISWGNEGHMAINKIAALKLPADMPQVLKQQADYISYNGPEPDRWRDKTESTLKYAQEPDHFMDMEYVDWMKQLPPDRYLFIRAIYEHRAANAANATDMMYPEKIGFQPYATIEVYDKLKVSFREYRKAQKEGRPTADAERNITYYAGWLGHYVGDGANPLHTTKNYNGWTDANPNGYTTEHDIHWKMEGPIIGRIMQGGVKFDDLVGAPKKLDKPFEDYVAYLRESQTKVEEVYKLEKACGFEGKASPEAREFLRQQLGRGAQMLLNLWYTAWIESAVEPPPYVAPKREAKTPDTRPCAQAKAAMPVAAEKK